MTRFVRLLTVMMVVLAACGGGDSEAASTTTLVAAGDDPTTSTTTTTESPVDSGAGASGDFCGFLGDYVDDTDFSPIGLSPEGIEGLFKDNLAAMQQARGLAPSEIAGDVGLFVDAYGDFIDFMDDFDFNFLAISEAAQDDPRLTALEDPELEAAGKRIEDFCGIEGDFIATPPSSSGGGGGAVLPTATLPEGFPDELVPPGGQVVASFDVAGTKTVGFELDSSSDDVIAYYTGILGDPLFESSEPLGAAWSAQYEGSDVNVTMAEYAPGKINVNIIIVE